MDRPIRDLEKNHKNKQAKKVLEELVRKSIMTTMIHAICEWENTFGHLCNIDEEDETKLTEAEKKYDELFEVWRKSVLDRGNEQGRRLLVLLDSFNVDFKEVKIQVRQERDNKNG